MEIDLELYRRDVRVRIRPDLHLSVIDIAPEQPERTIVFLHGYGGKAVQWIYLLREFSNENRVIALDLRGHGQSDKPRLGFTMQDLKADVEGVLDVLGINQKIVLVGHSFGGALAAEFAVAHPARVERLVLIATCGEFHLNRLYRLLLRLPFATLQLVSPYTRGWLGAPPPTLKAWYQENLAHWKGWNLFPRLGVPTLTIRGHQDRVFEKPLFEEVTRLIPSVEDVDVGASGHMVMLERREAVIRAIQRFLEPTPRTWRDTQGTSSDAKRSTLLKARPWLPHYEEGVPYTIAVPRIPLHHLLDSAARRFPSRDAINYEGKRITYRQLEGKVNRFANSLRSLGLLPGDRVMLLLPNLPQLIIAFFGTLKAGGVAVFTQPTTDPEELMRQVKDCGARFLVTLTQFDELIYRIKTILEPSGASPLEHIIFTHISDYLPPLKQAAFRSSGERRKLHLLDIPMDASMHLFNRLLVTAEPEAPDVPHSPGDLAAIIYTGGTTDTPKGVMLSHRNLVANALQTRHWMPAVREGQERFLCVLPFAHSYGLTTALNLPISLGATLLVKSRFDVEDVLNTIKRYKPTIFPGVPRMYMAINDFPGVRKFNIESIKACISGSDPLPVEVQETFEKLTRGILVEGYGLTEASPVTHGNPLNSLRKVGSIGVPFPSTEARVVDLVKGVKDVAIGQVGELAVRGPQVMLGYWLKPEETHRILSRDGWLLTGDIAQMDPDGYFRIIARKVDMWYPSRFSEPAFPRDVEEALFEIPQVKEAAVVAIAGQPVAFVISRQAKSAPIGDKGITSEALIAYCKRRLPPVLVPRLVIFLDEFPRSFVGKVLRRELAKRLEMTNAESPRNPESELKPGG
jgi:long-chain acyl-CoA synthetase